jgi:hypothetical protein
VLSHEAAAVLQAAWDERLALGADAPVDTADLLIGLLQVPRTRRLLEVRGITLERVRAARLRVDGDRLARRLQAVTPHPAGKSRQVQRLAQRLGACIVACERSVIEPEDVLAILLLDGLGWGVSILEELGVDRRLLGAMVGRHLLPSERAWPDAGAHGGAVA